MKKINIRTENIILNALGTLRAEKHLNIYTIQDDVDKPLVYGINWCAMGTQSVEATKVFANDLVQATKIAEALNSLELVTDWNSNRAHIKEDMMEEWEEWLPKFYEVIKLADADLIEAGIDTMSRKFFDITKGGKAYE